MRLLLLILPIVLAACTPQPAPTVPVQTDSVTAEPGALPPGVPDPNVPSSGAPPVDVTAGDTPTSGEADPEGEARLADHRQRWEAQRPESYRFTYTRICFCPPQLRGPFSVTVRGDEAAETAYEGEGEPDKAALERAGLTIGDLFDVIDDAYERRAESVQATYDEKTGQPTSIQIDYHEQMADEEVGFTIEPVEPLAD